MGWRIEGKSKSAFIVRFLCGGRLSITTTCCAFCICLAIPLQDDDLAVIVRGLHQISPHLCRRTSLVHVSNHVPVLLESLECEGHKSVPPPDERDNAGFLDDGERIHPTRRFFGITTPPLILPWAKRDDSSRSDGNRENFQDSTGRPLLHLSQSRIPFKG